MQKTTLISCLLAAGLMIVSGQVMAFKLFDSGDKVTVSGGGRTVAVDANGRTRVQQQKPRQTSERSTVKSPHVSTAEQHRTATKRNNTAALRETQSVRASQRRNVTTERSTTVNVPENMRARDFQQKQKEKSGKTFLKSGTKIKAQPRAGKGKSARAGKGKSAPAAAEAYNK